MAVIAAVAVVGALMGRRSDDAPVAGIAYERVTVLRRTLSLETSLNGRLGHGLVRQLPVRSNGTVTWLPPQGTGLDRGDVVLRVDDRPVVLLFGAIPAFRTLTSGTGSADSADATGAGAFEDEEASDAGADRTPSRPRVEPTRGRDVRQFEENLRALGYRGFTIDDTYSDATAAAVKRWQRDLGVRPTGQVDLGDVIYAQGAIRVLPRTEALGKPVTDDVIGFTGLRKLIVVQATADDIGWARAGAPVDVTLPNGEGVEGKVVSVGRDAAGAPLGDGSPEGASGSDGGAPAEATLPVLIDVPRQKALAGLNSGPVTVSYVSRRKPDVLTVPVSALVALAEGGYGVERAGEPAGRFIAVTPGMYADGLVEVSGPAITEGLQLRAPR